MARAHDPRPSAEHLYLADEPVFLTGIQALVRLLLTQRRLDRAAGRDTAGFVAGYRGSPLGGFDRALWGARPLLEAHGIRHLAAVNEELAATAVTGTQQVSVLPRPRHRGVFALWYGKGPGVDRAGDALKHGNHLGASPLGGVLVVAGDDHGGVSSSYPHQSELAFQSFLMPVLHPADVGELIALGLWGWALSRFSGCWVGLKAVSEVVESAAVVDPAALPRAFRTPDFDPPPGGLHIGPSDFGPPVEERLLERRMGAVEAFVAANPVDRVVADAPGARRGILVVGKTWGAVRAALDGLGLDEARLRALGVRILRVAMPWPLDASTLRRFALDLDSVLVVEEKHPLVEGQIRDLLYGLPAGRRPQVLGKRDGDGAPLLARTGELHEEVVAPVLARWLGVEDEPQARRRLEALARAREAAAAATALPRRAPFFCPGCPHSRSTRVPEGGLALAGVGCHYLAARMERRTVGLTAMGCEGANWVGAAPFSEIPHVFQNMGEGTYFHSGLLAIRQAVAAGTTMTFRILYNDAVAMTGGQPVDGPLGVAAVVRQLEAEGVAAVEVVAEDPAALGRAEPALRGRARPREALEAVQRRLAATPGVTVLVYVQTCAAEKRRRRRRRRMPEPPRQVFIHPLVCEDCGDCVVQSNCIAVVPARTAGRRHRAIDHSACNKDYTCLEGLCPSLVTVEGVRPRRAAAAAGADPAAMGIPAPQVRLEGPWRILLAGVGGTGVVTVAALLAAAARAEGRAVATLDFTGMAQKGGAVLSHVTLAPHAADIPSPRIGAARADAVIGGDLLVAAGALAAVRPGHTQAVLNLHEAQTGASVIRPHERPDTAAALAALRRLLGAGLAGTVDATALARALEGDTQTANVLLLGYAFQLGLVPLRLEAMERAFAGLGDAAGCNRRAFHWGRLAAHDPARFEAVTGIGVCTALPVEGETLEDAVAWRARELAAYQDARLARRYREAVERVRTAAAAVVPEHAGELALVAARAWFRLLAHKDAYEVARLYTDGRFEAMLGEAFEGRPRVRYHFAWPPLRGRDPVSGRPRKLVLGDWVRPLLRGLAAMRRVRGMPFDPLRRTRERRQAEALVAEYERTVERALSLLSPSSVDAVRELLAWPEMVRGYGAVRDASVAQARAHRDALLAALAGGDARPARAA